MTPAHTTTGTWEDLASALRSELAEHGGLLALLDEQRTAIATRDVDRLLELNHEVEAQARAANTHRGARERMVAALSQALAGTGDLSLRDLLPHMPPGIVPLFEALLESAADVLGKAREKGHRNRLLLGRATELNEEILRRLQPRSVTKTYNARGTVALRASVAGGLDLSA